MRVLVVTPTLGQSPWLTETIGSVAALSGLCTHVLVTPASAVSSLTRRFPGVSVVSEGDRPRGMYAAINAAARTLVGWDALTYINDDDMLLLDFKKVALAVDACQGRMTIAYGQVRLIDSKGNKVGTVPSARWSALNALLYAQDIEPLYQQGAVMSRTAFEHLGGFDDSLKLCGDTEILARACQSGIPFVPATRREVAAFRLRSGQLSRNRAAMEAERAAVKLKLKLAAQRLSWRHHFARWAFRIGNVDVYLRRVQQHGWISISQLQDRIE